MPFGEDGVYCVNHPDTEMLPQEGFHSLPFLEQEDSDLTFRSDRGIPVVVYFCPQCGYLEVYAAQFTSEWTEELEQATTEEEASSEPEAEAGAPATE